MINEERQLLQWLLEAGEPGERYTIENYSDGLRLGQHASGYPNPIARKQVDRTLVERMRYHGLLDAAYRPTLKAKKDYYANS
jgi:hypothetical protein